MRSVATSRLLLTALTVAALAPFLNRAFHVDDALFLWIAQQIASHPLDPYGFDVNWVSFVQPMSVVMQNPPLCSYYIALAASMLGWSEPALHSAFLLPAIAAVLGTFALARRFCRAPVLAALLSLFTPVFLVCGISLMCDLVLLAFWVWAIELWLRALERHAWRLYLASAVLVSAAALTKYFGIALLPLLAAYSIARERRLVPSLLFLLIPAAVLLSYDLWTAQLYEHGLFSAARRASASIAASTGPSYVAQLLIGLAFSGGCLGTVSLFLFNRSRKVVGAVIGISFALALLFYFVVASWVYLDTNKAIVSLQGGVFTALGAALLALALLNVWRTRTSDAWLLFFWVGGTFVFASFFNWSVTGRTFLPLAPVAAILVVEHFEHALPRGSRGYLLLVPAAALSLLIAFADYRQANCARAAARLYQARYGLEANKVVFLGHWGFQYYMQRWGARPFDRNHAQLASGEILIAPAGERDVAYVVGERIPPVEELVCETLPFLSTSKVGTGASFYSSFGGPLPWVFNRIPPERYYSVRAR